MSSAELFELISIISFSLSGLMLIIAVVVFFKLKIPQVIGYLTGRTAEKKIKEIEKRSTSANANTTSKHMTAKIATSAIDKNGKKGHNDKDKNQTTVLESSGLSGEATTVLSQESSSTTVLNQPEAGATAVLSENTYTEPVYTGNSTFEVETDITLTHTDETID